MEQNYGVTISILSCRKFGRRLCNILIELFIKETFISYFKNGFKIT
jgi:hypothetical protein